MYMSVYERHVDATFAIIIHIPMSKVSVKIAVQLEFYPQLCCVRPIRELVKGLPFPRR